MKKDAYYFPHFCNARGDRKIKRLMKDLGVEGYGLYFMLLEVLREQDGFMFPLSDIDLLADEFRTSEAKLKTVIINYSLFEVDQDSMFFSPKFNEYMQPYLNMKQQRIQAAKKSVEARRKKAEEKQKALTTVERPLNDSINDRSTVAETTVKQSKVKKSKVKESKDNIYNAHAVLFDCSDFTDSYNGFKQMRKLIKSPLTDRAEKIILNKITKLSGGDVDKAVTILDQSTQNSWKDIYELKNNQQVINKNQPKSSTPTEKRKFTY
jgi:hypothetical protein